MIFIYSMLVDWESEGVDGFFFLLVIFPLLLVTLCTGVEFQLALEA